MRKTKTVENLWEMRKFASGELFSALPELRFVGRSFNYRTHDAGLAPHHHASAMEITYIKSGKVNWWADKEESEVFGGQIYVSWPYEVHGSAFAMLEPCKMYWFALDLWKHGSKNGRTLLDLPKAEAEYLEKSLQQLSRRLLTVTRTMAQSFEDLLEASATPRDPLSLFTARSKLLDILKGVIQVSKQTATTKTSPKIQKALNHMNTHYMEKKNTKEIAASLGWSHSHFNNNFRNQVGVPPAQYLLRRRITEACRILNLGKESITQVAFGVGFSNSQYFATAFKKMVGMTPRDYAKAGLLSPRKHADREPSVNY